MQSEASREGLHATTLAKNYMQANEGELRQLRGRRPNLRFD
jgi:hypothetical protein